MIDPKEKPDLIYARRIYNSTIHPDTGQPVPIYFRMSGFVLFNTPILFGTILAAQTPLNIMFWQFVNQSYNAGMNYANRNASSPYTQEDLMKGYTGAVSASIIISVGLNRLFAPMTR